MFRRKPSQRAPAAPALPPGAAASGHGLEDTFAPIPLPDVLEDNSDAAWQLWLAANDAPCFGETVRMELSPDD